MGTSDIMVLLIASTVLLLICSVGVSVYRLFTWKHSDEWIDRELRKRRGR